jgi:hypothetical protein
MVTMGEVLVLVGITAVVLGALVAYARWERRRD